MIIGPTERLLGGFSVDRGSIIQELTGIRSGVAKGLSEDDGRSKRDLDYRTVRVEREASEM